MATTSFEAYRDRYQFNPAYEGWMAAEYEGTIVDSAGRPLNLSPEIIPALHADTSDDFAGFTSEEPDVRTVEIKNALPKPTVVMMAEDLLRNVRAVRQFLTDRGHQLRAMELTPAQERPVPIYPHNDRYVRFAELVGEDIPWAMDQVHSVQFNIGVSSFEQGLAVRNRLITLAHAMLDNPDYVDPERRRLFEEIIFPYPTQPCATMEEYFEWQSSIEVPGHDITLADNPKFDWSWVRFLPDGRVEFRPIGARPYTQMQLIELGQLVFSAAYAGLFPVGAARISA